MLEDKNFNNKTILFVLTLFAGLIVFSLYINSQKNNDIGENKVNPFFKKLPLNYVGVLNKNDLNPSFKLKLIEEKHKKQLIILKESPASFELYNDFLINIYPTDKSKLKNNNLFYSLSLVNKAVIYKSNNNEIASFSLELPFIGIEKITVKQILRNKKAKFWTDTLKIVSENKISKSKIETQISKYANIYTPLLKHLLKNKEIKFLKGSNVQSDEIIEIGIPSYSSFLTAIERRDQWAVTKLKSDGIYSEKIKNLVDDYMNGNTSFNSLFNIKKFAAFFAIRAIFANERCEVENLHLMYNTSENKIEPVFVINNCIGEKSKSITNKKIKNQEFVKEYIRELMEVSELNFENILTNNESVLNEIKTINNIYPEFIFSYNYLKINQLKIKKNLSQSTVIKSELISIDKERMILSVVNVSYFPVNIIGLNHKKKKEIVSLSLSPKILSGNRDTIVIDLPKSFQNLFVSKKEKKTGFLLHKHIYDLSLKYQVSGINETLLSPIIPYQENEVVGEDLFRAEKFINNHEDILIDFSNKLITFKKDSVTISSPLIIPSGFSFSLKAGNQINIMEGGKIVSNSPLNFKGTKAKPIKIYSSDKKGQGMFVLSQGEESNLEYVIFDHLANLTHGNWNVTGAVTFYESPVNLSHVIVSNNRCEDALNIVRTSFIMENCIISGTQSDAFDGDFVKGSITNSSFTDLGNDAIDVSGSDLVINNVQISKAGDKGLSAGENSRMEIDNVEITDSEIAIAGKDFSVINANNLKIRNTKLAFTAFQKKPEFGPSNIIVNTLIMSNVETKYLIENTSSMMVDGKMVKTSQNVKDRMYGVEFGVSSDQTRNKQ